MQAGPPPVPNRTGISSALRSVPIYQIDCGLGSLNAFTDAGLRFDQLKSLFITRTDPPSITTTQFLSGGYTQLPSRAARHRVRIRTGRRVAAQRVGSDPPTVDRAPIRRRIAAMTAALHRAFAYTSNIFIRDMGTTDIEPHRRHRDRGTTGVGLP